MVARLAAQQAERRGGVPVVGLLVGPPAAGRRVWEALAVAERRAVVRCDVPDETEVATRWIVSALSRSSVLAT